MVVDVALAPSMFYLCVSDEHELPLDDAIIYPTSDRPLHYIDPKIPKGTIHLVVQLPATYMT